MKVLCRLILIALIPYLLTQCSLSGIPLGGGGSAASSNDPRPDGTVIAQGQLAGLSGKTVTGTVFIFLTGSNFVLRIEGLGVPSENNLQLQLYGSLSPSSPVMTSTLTSNTGNQNHPFNTGPGNIFNTVLVYSTMTHSNYGSATLTQTVHGSTYVIFHPPT